VVRWGRSGTRRLLAFVARRTMPVRRAYRGSMQLRVVTATLIASSLLVAIFGWVVATSITSGMVESRLSSALDQVRNARGEVTQGLNAVVSPDDPTLKNKMSALVAEQSGDEDRAKRPTVLLRTQDGSVVESRPGKRDEVEPAIPADLHHDITEGWLSYQYETVDPDGNGERPFLAVGTPVYTEQSSYELYFLFPLDAEADAAELVRNTLVVAGITLVLLLGVIAWLVTRMVVMPVRLAARTAQRLSAGLLHERMTVRGADDLARLAGSFNLMAESLHQQIVRLEDMSRLQRRFTSDVSHELRTPLTTVRMAADLLHDSREDFPAPAARSAELLQDELNRFEELLGDLLEISRFDAGFAALDTEAVEMAPIIESVIGSFDSLAGRCDVELRQHIPAQPVIAEIDARRVQRVLRNLVGNAVEHAEKQPVCVVMAASATVVSIVVRDRGVGLKEGEEKLVFNRFWRADPSRARQTGGTGLGLSISAEDAKLHNGQLEAMGATGHGAVFRLSLPLRAGDRVLTSPLPLDFSADPCSGADDET
jgi:two-component system sensor histidine kinase MtrB